MIHPAVDRVGQIGVRGPFVHSRPELVGWSLSPTTYNHRPVGAGRGALRDRSRHRRRNTPHDASARGRPAQSHPEADGRVTDETGGGYRQEKLASHC